MTFLNDIDRKLLHYRNEHWFSILPIVKIQNLFFKYLCSSATNFIKVHHCLTHHGLLWLPETRSLCLNHLTHPSSLICALTILWEILGCSLQVCRAFRKEGFLYSLIILFFSHTSRLPHAAIAFPAKIRLIESCRLLDRP